MTAALRVLRVYHSGRDPHHRGRERALAAAGIDVTLVVPAEWPGDGSEQSLTAERFPVVELPARRRGDVNRHAYVDLGALRRVLGESRPDVLDIHEEPFSLAARQWLRAAGDTTPVVMYTAQNIDKRYPPPFYRYERFAHSRAAAFYPCSQQAASVLRGKGFDRLIEVIGLGYDESLFRFGEQSLDADEIVLILVGRLVAEKGVLDAVHVLAAVNAVRPARLLMRGSGAETAGARELASTLGVAGRLDIAAWETASQLASTLRGAHVLLIPSHATATWVEQFGRVIVEAQASGAVVAGYGSGTIPEVAGNAGVIVPEGDVDELASRVARLVTDQSAFGERRVAGGELAAERTWRAVAARQAAMYAAVHGGPVVHSRLPRSPRRRRAGAQAEFGATASTLSGRRPFALPMLRRGGAVPAALATVCDAAAELASRLPGQVDG